MSEQLLRDLRSRELIAQLTAEEALKDHLRESAKTVYSGFDPTADSLHIGSLVPLLALRRFQLSGHKPILLIGGATGLIGDPSFKSEERTLNSKEMVESWADKIQNQVTKFLDFECGFSSAQVVNNLDWISEYNVLNFLREIGKHFSVNSMIQKESVKQRIEREGEGISYTEFSYILMQSLDFAQLYKKYNCSLQIGGSDQWGNITGGIDLTRRLHKAKVYGLTLPLVTKSDGTKFGKTEAGNIWLDPLKTSPYAFYQFWINVADDDVYKFLKYFTFLDINQIEEIILNDKQKKGRKSAQLVLAKEVTRLIHGKEGLVAAERISSALFNNQLDDLSEMELSQLALDGLPCTEIFESKISLVELLVQCGLAKTPRGEITHGQARKFIKNNAVTVNGLKVTEIDHVLGKDEGLFGQYHIIQRGKKNFHLLSWK